MTPLELWQNFGGQAVVVVALIGAFTWLRWWWPPAWNRRIDDKIAAAADAAKEADEHNEGQVLAALTELRGEIIELRADLGSHIERNSAEHAQANAGWRHLEDKIDAHLESHGSLNHKVGWLQGQLEARAQTEARIPTGL